MNDMDEKLSDLFHKASTQAPIVSFEETSTRFSNTIATGGGASIVVTFSKIIFSSVGLLSIITLSIITFAIFINSDAEQGNSNESTITVTSQDSASSEIIQDSPFISLPSLTNNATENKSRTDEVNHAANNKQHKADTNLQLQEIPDTSASAIDEFSESFHTSNPELNTIDEIDISNYFSPLAQNEIIEIQSVENIKLKDTEILFTFTELSTEWDFEKMAKRAKKAGIIIDYQVHHQRKERRKDLFLIRDFKIEMEIPGTNHSSEISVMVPKWGRFEVKFGWFVNEEGMAITLTESVRITEASSFYPKH